MSAWDLLSLLCRARCDARLVTAALAFAPPPPSYVVEGEPLRWVTAVDGTAAEFISDTDDTGSLPYEHTHVAVVTSARGVRVPVFVLLYPGAHFTLLYSHGNASDCGLMRETAIDLCLNCRVNVCLYEYPGYGPLSHMLPTEAGTFDAIEAAYSHLLRQPFCTSSEQIIAYGQSLGSGPTMHLAGSRPLQGVILHSAFTSGLRVITPNRCLACCDVFNNLNRMRALRVAAGVMIMHGTRDAEVPAGHAEELFDALPARFQRGTCPWLPVAGHNDILELHRDEYFIRVRAFITRMMPGACVYARDDVIPQSRAELHAAAQRVWQAFQDGTPFPEPPGARVVTSSGLTAPRAYVGSAGVGAELRERPEQPEALPVPDQSSDARLSVDAVAVDVAGPGQGAAASGLPVEEWSPHFSASARLEASVSTSGRSMKATRPTGPNPRPSARTVGRTPSGSVVQPEVATGRLAAADGVGAPAAALACYASSSIKLPPVS